LPVESKQLSAWALGANLGQQLVLISFHGYFLVSFLGSRALLVLWPLIMIDGRVQEHAWMNMHN
jgi:hypothetical protein